MRRLGKSLWLCIHWLRSKISLTWKTEIRQKKDLSGKDLGPPTEELGVAKGVS